MTLRARLRHLSAQRHARALLSAAAWGEAHRGDISDEDAWALEQAAAAVHHEYNGRFHENSRRMMRRPGSGRGAKQSTARWR